MIKMQRVSFNDVGFSVVPKSPDAAQTLVGLIKSLNLKTFFSTLATSGDPLLVMLVELWCLHCFPPTCCYACRQSIESNCSFSKWACLLWGPLTTLHYTTLHCSIVSQWVLFNSVTRSWCPCVKQSAACFLVPTSRVLTLVGWQRAIWSDASPNFVLFEVRFDVDASARAVNGFVAMLSLFFTPPVLDLNVWKRSRLWFQNDDLLHKGVAARRLSSFSCHPAINSGLKKKKKKPAQFLDDDERPT